MKAAVIKTFADPASLELAELSDPVPQSYDIKVNIKAAGVNQADVLQAKGKYPAPPGYPQDIPGLEFAGIVNAVGTAVEKFKMGDRVFGLIAGGAYSDTITIHADCVTKMPTGMSFIEAASLPEVFITAYDAVISQMKLAMGECLLISAIGSGVGLAALQIAKHIGVTVIGTSRSKDKLKQAEAFGLDHKILVEDNKFAAQVKGICPSGPNVILELVGGDYIVEDIECIASQGRIVLVGLLAGRSANLDLGTILAKRLLIRGTTLRRRPLAEKILANQLLEKNLVPLFQSGKLRPVIDQVFPLKDAAAAVQYLDSGKVFGKVVLACD
jgi:NADPH:quinone reductase